MRRLAFDPDRLSPEQRQWWDAWLQAAEDARNADAQERAEGREPAFRKQVWTELKVWMLKNALNGKCAYCETKFEAGSFGEAEHYRPKGRVRDGANKKVQRAPGGSLHEGYHWLAYDWRNLLPSCNKCNNTKRDKFPVAGTYVFDPSPDPLTLNATEAPLLLNPLFDDPADHLVFGAGGTVVAKDGDPRGEETIRVFGLDREELRTARIEQAEQVDGMVPFVLGKMYEQGPAALVDFMEKQVGDRAEYSVAVAAVVGPKLQVIIDGIRAAQAPRG